MMINNNTNKRTKSPLPIFLRLYRGNKALIQKIFACTILTSVLLQHQNCGMKQTFEESKRALPSHSVELPSHSVPLKCTKKTLYKKLTATEDTTSNQLDMLLVIDDSGSMNDLSSKLAARLNGFVHKLKNSGIDWQMCVTTAGTEATPYSKGDNGRPIQWQGGNSGHILRKNSGNLNQIFIDTIDYLYRTSTHLAQGIKAMNLSIQKDNIYNCYRDKAALSVILISDANQETYYPEEGTPQSFIQTVKDNFSPGKRLTVNSIVVKDELCRRELGFAEIGDDYIELSNLTGGSVQSICQSDYSIALNDIHKKIDQSLSGLPLACVPTSKPTVTVDGRDYTHNVTVNGNQLFFNPCTGSCHYTR